MVARWPGWVFEERRRASSGESGGADSDSGCDGGSAGVCESAS